MSYPKQPQANYPPPGAPSQYPPTGAPGQYPPPGAPGQHPSSGAPGQYPPPGAPGQYPPTGAPGQYPPPGAPGQYPPPGAPGQYPPPGVPGQYPPTGAQGQYPPPGAPGQYPPPGVPPGAPGHYPQPGVPGQYPPTGAQGQYPPPGAPGYPPTGGHYPHSSLTMGWDAVDSDPDDYIRPKNDKYPMKVKFLNKTNKKVRLYWVNYKGKFKKCCKIKEGRDVEIDTFAGHSFGAETRKEEMMINGNYLYFAEAQPGSHGEVKAEITMGPKDQHHLCSVETGHPVRVKFSNRTHQYITLKWIDTQGVKHAVKDVAPKKAFILDTIEGRYFIAHVKGKPNEKADLNYCRYWKAIKTSKPEYKVLLTEDFDDSSSSSSSD